MGQRGQRKFKGRGGLYPIEKEVMGSRKKEESKILIEPERPSNKLSRGEGEYSLSAGVGGQRDGGHEMRNPLGDQKLTKGGFNGSKTGRGAHGIPHTEEGVGRNSK